MPVDHDLGYRALRASGLIPELASSDQQDPVRLATSGRGRPDTLK